MTKERMAQVLEQLQKYQRMALGICPIEIRTLVDESNNAHIGVCIEDLREDGETDESVDRKFTNVWFFDFTDDEEIPVRMDTIKNKLNELGAL